MLSTVSNQPHRRGHRHKRSAAISGDFDAMGMDIFRSPNQQHSHPISTISNSLPKEYSFGEKRSSQPQPPSLIITDEADKEVKSPKISQSQLQSQSQIPTITTTGPSTTSNPSSTPSPQKKHTRLNSWAHSFIRKDNHHNNNNTKQSKSQQSTEYVSSSSNDTTPENAYKSTQFTYGPAPTDKQLDVPEAIIDLDQASSLVYDPSSTIPRKKFVHRRTESAPELEDFLKFKVFSYDSLNNNNNNGSNGLNVNNGSQHNGSKNGQKNSAIFEEDEEDEEEEDNGDVSSSNSSNILSSQHNSHHHLVKNHSTNSLNSSTHSFKLQSPATVSNSIFATPTSTKANTTQQLQQQSSQTPQAASTSQTQQPRRGGANAARYQSYYHNSLLLSNALKSSESLSHITNGSNSLNNKSSISSFQTTYKQQILSSASSQTTNSSSALNSPSRFKFESKVYDMPDKDITSTPNRETSNSTNIDSLTCTPSSIVSSNKLQKVSSPTKPSRQNQIYVHKKSNSLLSSINLRIRRNSNSSTRSSSHTPKMNHSNVSSSSVDDISNINNNNNSNNEEEDIGDSTITPLNFGEPGPELDLVTMTPKIYKNNTNNNSKDSQLLFPSTPLSTSSIRFEGDNFDGISSPKGKLQNKEKNKNNHKKFFHWLKK